MPSAGESLSGLFYMKTDSRFLAGLAALIAAMTTALVGCSVNGVLPETSSRPKPAKLDKNAFVPSYPQATSRKSAGP
jgi:hypothetical protein